MLKDNLPELIANLHKAQKSHDIDKEIISLLNLAEYHYNRQNYEKSKRILHEILEFDKNLKNINYYLALICLQEDNKTEAIKYLEKELKINQYNSQASQLKRTLEIYSNTPFVTLFLLLLNSILFAFVTFPQVSFSELIKFSIYSGNLGIFSAITSLFFHADIIHFGVNMIILLMFGLILEKNIGSPKFLGIYLLSGIIGNIMQALVSPGTFVIGASSALFGLISVILMKEPLMDMRVFGIIKAPIILVFGVFFVISNSVNALFAGQFVAGDVAHMLGFLTGILISAFMFKETINTFYNWLGIFLGFSLIKFALDMIFTQAQFTFSIIIFIIAMLIIGTFISLYSYTTLKLSKLMRLT